jgi:hypothetical protein
MPQKVSPLPPIYEGGFYFIFKTYVAVPRNTSWRVEFVNANRDVEKANEESRTVVSIQSLLIGTKKRMEMGRRSRVIARSVMNACVK